MKITQKILLTFFLSLCFFVFTNVVSFLYFSSQAYEEFIEVENRNQAKRDEELADIIQGSALPQAKREEYGELFSSMNQISGSLKSAVNTSLQDSQPNEIGNRFSIFSNTIFESAWRKSHLPEAQFLRSIFLSLFWVNICLLLFLGIILFYFLRSWFYPIKMMTSSLDLIATRQVFEPLTYTDRDEFYPLVNTINTLNDSLERQRKVRSIFLSDLSHELKTPMTALKCLLEGIEDGIIPLDTSQVSLISHELERLITISSRISDDSFQFQTDQLQEVEIVPFLERIITEYRALLLQNNQKIILDPSTSTTLFLHPHFFDQVIHNIFMNFIKYSGEGTQLMVSCEVLHQKKLLHFSDNGNGVPQENIPFLIEKFYQVDTARNDASFSQKNPSIDRGYGIGLSIVAEFCQFHKASLDIVSDTGKGFCITISFPMS